MRTDVPETPMPGGLTLPVLGLGTWMMGESAALADQEAAALTRGLDIGLRLIDTAEMYADGKAEEIVAKAIAGRRDEAFLVSKVYPGMPAARAPSRPASTA